METKGRMNDRDRKPQELSVPRDEWDQDLRPNSMAGQNIGPDPAGVEERGGTAYDLKPLHRMLSGIADDDLKQIPVLPEGAHLQQGATYIDLCNNQPEEFTATGDMMAERGHYFIPKDKVPYPLWNLLTGKDRSGNT